MSTTQRALDILTDLTITPREAVRRFEKLSRRWTGINRAFLLHCGGVFRAEKERRAFDVAALGAWSDDGGRA